MYWRRSVMAQPLLLSLVLMVLVSIPSSVKGDNVDPPVVRRTRQGPVRGRYQQSSSGRPLLAFYNLPYAKPPVGALRFRDPQPPEEWAHIRDAATPGGDCIQKDDFLTRTGVSGSEDCLYLNVFTPQVLEQNLLPVMFWVHGGGFFAGGGNAYGPDYLLDHDVVLVTINYRLGPFGFLSTEDDAAPGNFGLKDQVAALRWVHENIARFGGDPGRVTVFGESAGAASVHFLALSPLTTGLVHRVIMESGSALTQWALARRGVLSNNTRKIAAAVGCPTDKTNHMVDCLRTLDDYVLLESQNHLKKWGVDPLITMQPVVEGERTGSFLPRHPLHLKPPNLEWIIGTNENEGGIRTAVMYGNREAMKDFQENFNKLLPITLNYDTASNKDVITEKIRNFYFPSENMSLRELTDMYTDSMFLWNSDEAARLYKNVSSVFYYLLSYRGKYRTADPFKTIDFDFGAGHTDDLFYLFPKNPFYPGDYKLPERDMKLVDTITTLWTNFAKTGNPTPDGKPVSWPKVTSDDELEYLDIGQELNAKKGLAKKRLDFSRTLPFRETEAVKSFNDEL